MEDDNVVLRPSVPPPTASSLTVHHFFIQFFRALNHQRSLQEAEQMAERIHVEGTALYELPEKKFIDEFGFEGQTIYQALRRSKWGYVSLSFKSNLKRSLLILIYSIGQLFMAKAGGGGCDSRFHRQCRHIGGVLVEKRWPNVHPPHRLHSHHHPHRHPQPFL